MIVGGLDLHRKASLDIIRLTVILYKTGGNIYEKVSIFYNCSNCRFAAVWLQLRKIPGHGNGSNLVNEGNSLCPTSSDKLLSPAPSAEPLKIIPLQSYDNDSTLINPDAKKYIDNYSGYNKAEPLEVPLYSYESLLELGWDDDDELEKNYCVLLGNDYNYGLIKHPNFSLRLGELLTRIPEGAIRIMPSSNTGYVMHDTENGVRLFHFFRPMKRSLVRRILS